MRVLHGVFAPVERKTIVDLTDDEIALISAALRELDSDEDSVADTLFNEFADLRDDLEIIVI